MLTLVAPTPDAAARVPIPPDGYRARPVAPSDVEELGALYFRAYDPGVASATLDDAVRDIQASFDGEYGSLWLPASEVIHRSGEIVAAILTVHRAPWPDTPQCPFVIELFVDRAHRRRGLARVLVERCLVAAAAASEAGVALRVDAANAAALGLYRAVGFAPREAR